MMFPPYSVHTYVCMYNILWIPSYSHSLVLRACWSMLTCDVVEAHSFIELIPIVN